MTEQPPTQTTPRPSAGSQRRSATLSQRVEEDGPAVVGLLGITMVVVGGILAAAQRSEASLVWGGTVLVVIGLLGNRIKSFDFGPGGAKVEMRDQVEQLINEAADRAPAMPVLAQAAGAPPVPMSGRYLTQEAFGAAVTAISSKSPREQQAAIDELNAMAARGTAVVRMVPADEIERDTPGG